MIQNYFLLAIRNLMKNKFFSFINIFGLAVGMAACFLISTYVLFELSYDRFNQDYERIFRVTNIAYNTGGEKNHQATNHPGAGPALKENFPEVEDYARIVHQSIFMGDVSAWSFKDDQGDTKIFNEEKVYDADASFLTLFTFPFIEGDPQNALRDKSSVVLSESIARKFFGNESALGKTITLNGWGSFTITAVVRVPENTHLHFDILVSYFMKDGWGEGWNHDWDWKWAEFYTYVRLKENTDVARLEDKFPELISQNFGELLRHRNTREAFAIQPVADIHLKGEKKTKEHEAHGNIQLIYFLSIVAGLILLVAWINYINLSTCKSVERAREVGVRKVAGATKTQLVTQFLFESFTINLLSIALAFLLVALALPYFNQLTGKNIGLSLFDLPILSEPIFWLMLTGLILVGSIGAGLYPAFVLSSFKAVAVLKGKFFGSASGILLRRIMVGSQFAISVALISGTLVVFRQVSFMRNQDMGYTKDQLLIVKAPMVGDSTYGTRLQAFKSAVKTNPKINSMAPTSEIPGKLISQVNAIRKAEDGLDGNVTASHFYIDTEFAKTFGVKVVAGRNFLETEYLRGNNDRTSITPVILNVAAIERLGYKNAEEAVHQQIMFGLGTRDWPAEIVGVFGNHHQRSLKDGYSPILFFPRKNYSGQYFTFNMSLDNPQETISRLEALYKEYFSDNEFEYFFLDDYFDQQYKADQQFGKVFGLFSGLALLVACLGLFGLSTFMISQRLKEIAIRKVLGASIPGMVKLFSKDFIRLVILSNLIALPIVYVISEKWLNTFAFRVNMGLLMFILPAVVLLFISLATVGFQTIKTGSGNPVRALRTE